MHLLDKGVSYQRQVLQTEYAYELELIANGGQRVALDLILRQQDNGDFFYFLKGQSLNHFLDFEDLNLTWELWDRTQTGRDLAGLAQSIHYINPETASWESLDLALGELGGRGQDLVGQAIYTEGFRLGDVDVYASMINETVVSLPVNQRPARVEQADEGLVWLLDFPIYPSLSAEDLVNYDLDETLLSGRNLESEHWGMISASRLADFEARNELGGETVTQADIRVADLEFGRKLRSTGIYYFLPESYYPYHPAGFWPIPAEHIGERFMRSLADGSNFDGASYISSLAILSANHCLAQQEPRGYWLTMPASTWLYSDYGVEAGFYDTRFSTDAGIFLFRFYDYYSKVLSNLDPDDWRQDELRLIYDALIKYADFVADYARNYSYETEGGGLLVQDYFHPDKGNQPTHVSLNHLVTEMNFLLMIIDQDREWNLGLAGEARLAEYDQVARKIRQAVNDTREAWIKYNGDLWYAYMPDATYGLLDYPLLTRNDLVKSLDLMDKVWGEQDDDFRFLIDVKEAYLRANKLPLY